MTPSTSPLGWAIRCALATAGTAAALPALAQDSAATAGLAQNSTAPTTLDRIEITGSRIRQVDLETAQPVLTISRADIERQGFNSVADILQNLTAMGSPAASRASPLSAGESAGGSFVDMRGLGAQRTLVLVNGKRMGMTTGGLQDISTLPAAAVERMEVLKDGASAIYGSDAMAGVVNIITRRNVEGISASLYRGQYSQGDGDRTQYDVVGGWSNDRASISFAAEHVEEKGVWARDRWFSAYTNTDRHPADGWTTVGQWGRITGFNGPGCSSSRGCSYSLDRGVAPGGPDSVHLSDDTPFTGDVSNSNEQMHVQTPIKRDSIFVDGRVALTDTLHFNTQLAYNRRETTRQIAGYPFQSGAAGINPMSKDSWFNPFGSHHGYQAPSDVNWNRRLWEVPRVSVSDLTTWQGVAAFEGSFELGAHGFDWEAGYQYNRSELTQRATGNLHKQRVEDATGPSFYNAATGKVECGTPGAPIAGCMPWNPLVPYGQHDPNGLTGNPALMDWLFPEEISRGRTTSRNLFATVSGTVLTLPAGDLGMAVGVESRREDGRFIPDPLAQTGATTNLAAGPTGGGYRVDEAYLELSVPLLRDLPAAHELTVSAATRYSDYSTFGDTLNSKFGFTWRPIEQLLLRGTWAQGFRSPTIANLYGGGSQTFTTGFRDPCDTVYGAAASSPAVRARCAADIANADSYRQLGQGNVPIESSSGQTPLPFTNGSNPDLQPETATSRTLGVVWSPGFAPGLNIALDWWKIRIDDTIVADHPNDMLRDCYELGIAERCAGFTRDPALGIVNQLKYGVRNSGFRETQGYDLELSHRWETDWGTLRTDWKSTYVVSSLERSTNDAGVVPTPGNGLASAGGIGFRTRSNLSLDWERGNFGINWGVRYYSAVKEQCFSPRLHADECSHPGQQAPWYSGVRNYNRRGSTTFHDVQVRYSLPWDATVSLGANNVFEKYGPIMYTQPSANFSYYGGYDIGRFIYMKYQQRF
ncbi:TonB-dependent receptor domain-containing protein [Stenotrophomonas maltophilia]|uniref:TonB-dependent receptor domain-containing protein n=1 Tax=Stenotrophomonas maltophilia TaxID=40324 RepID=UPI0009A1BEAF|nr:TonB-dependent receptor [Stenotrophomonas maltophilia]